MTNTTKVPFLFFKKKRGFFFSQSECDYIWSSDESENAGDISFYLLNKLKGWNIYEQKIVEILARPGNLAKAKETEYFWKKKNVKICLENLAELDELDNWLDCARTINIMLNDISLLINQGYTIGINFREVFLVREGEEPPSHFRPNIDICVTSITEYKKRRELLSYQLGKIIFNEFKPRIAPQSKTLVPSNQAIIYSDNPHYEMWNDYKTPLKDYRYFNSALASFVHFFYQVKYQYLRNISPVFAFTFPVFAFTFPVSVSDLIPIFQYYSGFLNSELILIFKGSHYENELERQKVYEELLKLIEQSKCTFMVHVVLITQDNLKANLLDLKPNTQEKPGLFQPLPQGAGYYLSSTKILSPIYRAIQALSVSPERWFDKLESLNKRHQKKPKAQPGAYILATETSKNVRKSKTLTRGQLKSKVRLAVTHQEVVTQTQTVNEEVQQTQAQKVNVNEEISHSASSSTERGISWNLKTNLDDFCKKLEFFAKERLPKITEDEQLLEQAGYCTQFYLKNHSRRNFYEQIANDQNVRLQIATKLFGHALIERGNESGSFLKVKLPHYSVDNIEEYIANRLIENLENTRDGLPVKNRFIKESFIFGRTLYGVKQLQLYGNSKNHVPNPLIFSHLSYLSQLQSDDTDINGFQLPLNYLVLLTEDELASVESKQKDALIKRAKALLTLFQPHPPLSQEEILAIEVQFLQLLQFYFPDRTEDITRLEQFISRFEVHNEDNLKILLQIIIGRHKQGLELFFKLLFFLEERSLLDNFYKTHFQYAISISAVERLFKIPIGSIFLKLALKTPIGNSTNNWPIFEKFAHHLLLFAAQNNLALDYNELNNLENFWKRIYAKFLSYSGEQKEAQKLLNNLIQQLISKQGLAIAPLSEFETFYIGLENILDHALEKHALKEQIDEICGISLLPTDAPYACEWNGFQVICPEMQIHATAINPLTKTYSVSTTQLLNAMTHHKSGDASLKIALFRYLGTQSLREDIAFYRTLYQKITQTEDSTAVYISEILCAYYVINYTGNEYRHDINQKTFSMNFIHFLTEHGLNKTISATQTSTYIKDFFVNLHQIPTDEQNGIQSLWSIWREQCVSAFTVAKTPIPEIFLRKFTSQRLGHFLLTQKENLEKALPALDNDPKIVATLINQWSTELNIPCEHKRLVEQYLKRLYPGLDMKTLLQNTTKIAGLLESMSSLSRSNPKSFIYLALDNLMDKNTTVDAFVCLIELIAVEMTKHHGQTEDKMTTNFLLTLGKRPQIYQALPQAKILISILLASLLKIKVKDNLELLLNLIETLLPLDMDEAQQVFTALIQMVRNNEGVQFLNAHPYLNAVQLRELSKFVQKVQPSSLAMNIMEWLYEKNSYYDLSELNAFLDQKPIDEIQCLLRLAHRTCQLTERDFIDELKTLKDKPLNELKKIDQLQKLYPLNAQEILALLATPCLNETIAAFQRQKYQENLQRYHYDPQVIRKQIARIKLKSHQTDEEPSLSKEEQECLWRDYQLLMSYMTEKPIKVEIQGVTKELTINGLTDNDVQSLFKTLQTQLSKGENRLHNQLLLIAISAEALYRTTNKFPRSTQLITLLKCLHYPGNLIHEVKTGEGKSIIAAMHGALLCSLGRTVDIVTENNQLAKNALEKFGPFYQYLGISHGENILTAQSAHHEYIANGMNYSTASNLALFRTRMALEKKVLPKNPALVSDEIDAALTTTVQFRLAATLDPLLNNSKTWACIYQYVLQFVKEEEIYLKNRCSQEEDILNLKNYFIIQNPEADFLKFTNKISNELLGVLIESAMIAYNLEENIDYYVVETKDLVSKHYYAAPIIASTNRPDPNVSYSEYVQQLLHTLLNNKNPPPTYPFIIEASTEALIVISAKNFFDYYRLNDGPIVGLTGTAGSLIERAEFYKQHGLVAISYPTFHPDRSEDLGLVTSFGTDAHHKKIIEWIENHKKQNVAQPILLITHSPQATEHLRNSLATHTKWKLQCYHGYEDAGKSEENVIYTAGQDHWLTIANQSLARGADIEPLHENGLVVINTCTDLTPSELRQIQGRAARNGKSGQFISIIDAQAIGSPSDSEELLTEAFKAHQHQLSLKQQQERLKMRLLEEARYLMVSEYVLKLRATADKILMRQFGEGNSIVDHEKFTRTLSTLNQRAEKHYAELLDKHKVINDEITQEFLAARIKDQQEMLAQWFAEHKFSNVRFVEPSIPLEFLNSFAPQLQGTTIAQLSAFADIFHRKWKIDGHQQTKQHFENIDELVTLFDPYFKKKCSFKQALGQTLEEKGLINAEQIDVLIVKLKTNLDEMLEYAQSISVVGRFVPVKRIKKFVADYLTMTKTQIQEKKWEQVSLPTIDLSGISTWFSGVSTALTLSSLIVGGPIPFIVNRFIVPTVFGWIKNKLKQQFASSKSLVAQILIGIDDIGNDLPEAIKALTSLSEEKEIKVGLLLDKFGTLAKNKALLLALSNYLKLIKRSEYIPFVQAIPDVLGILETYRDCQPNALLNVDTLMVFIQQASHSELILKTLENSPYKVSLERIAQLNPKFITQVSAFSFPEFMNLLKVAAHPNFFTLLTKLPPDTTYNQLCQWIEKAPADLSEDSQQAIKELLDYQTNRERIAEENKQELLNLRTTYSLTTEKFKAGLDKLTPQYREQTKAISTQELKSSRNLYFWVKHAAKLLVLLALTAFMIYSAVYLSAPIALTCLILIGWIAFPYIKQQISTWRNALKNTVPEALPLAPNILHSLNKNQTELSCLNSLAPNQKESKNEKIKSHNHKPTSRIDSEHGFFAPQVAKETSSETKNDEYCARLIF